MIRKGEREINLSIRQMVDRKVYKQLHGKALRALGGPRTPDRAEGPACA